MAIGPREPSANLLLTPNLTMRRLVHEALARLGHNPDRIHESAMQQAGGEGLEYQNQAPLFWSRVAGLIDDPDAGLHLAEAAPVRLLDEVLCMMYLSEDLRSALQRLVRFQHLLSGGFQAELRERPGRREAILVLDLNYPGFGLLRQQSECVTLVLLKLLNFCTDDEFRLLGVDFRHPAPAEQGEHRRLLGLAPRFAQGHDSFRFAARLLDRPLPNGNPELAMVVERHAEERRKSLDANQFLYQVRFWIDSHLRHSDLNVDHCARDFGLSRIGLRRSLGARNVLFQELHDELRRQRAGDMLSRGESVSATARACGFASDPQFEDAFERWFGCPPERYRQRQGGGKT